MRERCNDPNNNRYQYYGGKGITVCDRWDSFENFLEDMGERPEGMTLDRKEADKGYYKENCRWATPKEQQRWRRKLVTHDGETHSITDWAAKLGVPLPTVKSRMYRHGYTVEEALWGK